MNKIQNNIWIMNLGILSFIFGLCYLSIPLYKLFCQKVGLDGDLEKKDYTFEKSQLNFNRKIKVIFKAAVDPDLKWDFEPIQKELYIHPGETALMFYKVHNHQNKPIIGLSIYNVFPEYASNYFSKIQCFCFITNGKCQ